MKWTGLTGLRILETRNPVNPVFNPVNPVRFFLFVRGSNSTHARPVTAHTVSHAGASHRRVVRHSDRSRETDRRAPDPGSHRRCPARTRVAGKAGARCPEARYRATRDCPVE